MSLAKEFGCGHFRWLPTRYKECPICKRDAQKMAQKDILEAERDQVRRDKRNADKRLYRQRHPEYERDRAIRRAMTP